MTKSGNKPNRSLAEALPHVRGEIELTVRDISIEAPDLKAIRERLALSQAKMAPLLGMSVSGYRKWEQGQRSVSGCAKALLRVMEREPEAVLRALTDA